MSQFDLPRINFFGKTAVNPATANNNSLLPLVIFDPVRVKVVLPPRVYITGETKALLQAKFSHFSNHFKILTDTEGAKYFEIISINNDVRLRSWVITPLGESPLDQDYHHLYQYIKTLRNPKPLTGLIPAGWNYYGGMDFKFSEVKICSINMLSETGTVITYTPENSNLHSEIDTILNASLTLENEQGRDAATMVDVIPGLSFYSQIFFHFMILRKDEQVLMKGKPCKASLRFLNVNRILNQEGSEAASGTFYCFIPISELEGGLDAPIIRFFDANKARADSLAGLFIRFDLSDVEINSSPDYKASGLKANPASTAVLGSITPAYHLDMKSITMGRQLISVKPIWKQSSFPPLVCQFNKKRKVLSLDMIGFLPQVVWKNEMHKEYCLFNLGKLQFFIVDEGLQEVEIGSLMIDETNVNRQTLIKNGGVLEINYRNNKQLSAKLIDSGTIMVKRNNGIEGEAFIPEEIMRESEFMVSTDQAGIYINEGDNPEDGYVSYSHIREPCTVQIFRRGKPIKKGIPMTIVELNLVSPIEESVKVYIQKSNFKANQSLLFPTSRPANLIYVLYPGNLYTGATYVIPDILKRGFFINLRVLPQTEIKIESRPPSEEIPVTFSDVYKQLLRVYDLIYPSSSVITPFTEDHFRKGAKFILQRMKSGNWGSFSYMPSSRDMSADRLLLMQKWTDQEQDLAVTSNEHAREKSDK